MKFLIGAIAALALFVSPFAASAQQSFGTTSQGVGMAGATGNSLTQIGAPAPSHVSITSVPPVYAPALTGGANPCTTSASGGVSALGFGISLGVSSSEEGCNQRNWYILLMSTYTVTKDPRILQTALALACKANDTLRDIALPGMCAPAQAPIAQAPQLHLAAAPVQATAPAPAPKVATLERPAFCGSPMSAQERHSWSKVCGFADNASTKVAQAVQQYKKK